MNFCKRSYQPILRYLYTEVKKRRGEISLHKHFNINHSTLQNSQYNLSINLHHLTSLSRCNRAFSPVSLYKSPLNSAIKFVSDSLPTQIQKVLLELLRDFIELIAAERLIRTYDPFNKCNVQFAGIPRILGKGFNLYVDKDLLLVIL